MPTVGRSRRMESTFNYRFLQKVAWGIAIDVTARFEPYIERQTEAREVVPGIWLYISQSMAEDEWRFLQLGIRLIKDEIGQRLPFPRPVLINVISLYFNPCDYQAEGLACAIMGWAAQDLGFTPPEIGTRYDEDQRRYVFCFPPNG